MKLKDLYIHFGITRGVLRSYEEHGFITPDKSGSGQRFYTPRELFTILELRRQQNLGLSLDDLTDMRSVRDLNTVTHLYTNLLNKQKQSVVSTIKKQEMLLNVIEQEKEMISTLKYNLGRYWFEQRPALAHTEFSNMPESISSKDNTYAFHPEWAEYAAYSQLELVCSIDIDSCTLSGERWAFVIPLHSAKTLGITAENFTEERPALITVIRCGTGDNDIKDAMRIMLAEAKKLNFPVAEDHVISARFCLHTFEDEQDVFYYKLAIPLSH